MTYNRELGKNDPASKRKLDPCWITIPGQVGAVCIDQSDRSMELGASKPSSIERSDWSVQTAPT